MVTKRIFTCFAMEDKPLRDLLVCQSNQGKLPFEFTEMSVKHPWGSEWKTSCRAKIKSCDGFLLLVTTYTENAHRQLWEVQCAKEEGLPIKGIWGNQEKNSLHCL